MRQANIIGAPKLKLGTFCSGIGAPEVAARGLFEPLWFSEIEPFPCAVLAHHWPRVPNLGDMTADDLVERIAGIGLPDVVVAGLPCQPFSVAGLRKGEADPRPAQDEAYRDVAPVAPVAPKVPAGAPGALNLGMPTRR